MILVTNEMTPEKKAERVQALKEANFQMMYLENKGNANNHWNPEEIKAWLKN